MKAAGVLGLNRLQAELLFSPQVETAEVVITDLRPETVRLLLQYCYGRLQAMPARHAEVRCCSNLVGAPVCGWPWAGQHAVA